jgi:hypothetical protein
MPTRPTIIGQLASLSFGQLASSIERIWCIQTCFSILSFDNSFKTSFKTGYSLVLQKQIDSFKSVSFFHRY